MFLFVAGLELEKMNAGFAILSTAVCGIVLIRCLHRLGILSSTIEIDTDEMFDEEVVQGSVVYVYDGNFSSAFKDPISSTKRIA